MGRIASFISPHGFGHAARAAAVMEAVQELDPSVHFEIFTQVPRWFFEASLTVSFDYHSLLTDIGLAQRTPLIVDLPETLRRLDEFLPFDQAEIKALARKLKELKCDLMLCDIAPMGIAVAREAGIPSILVENFTWDWIYEGYAGEDARIRPYIDALQTLFESADYHIQTAPVCRPQSVDLLTAPVSRKVRTTRARIREELHVAESARLVLITMGGIPVAAHPFLEQLRELADIHFVIPGASQSFQIQDNLILLPHSSNFFHPDLVNACDVVVGKVGYSTLAEVYAAGVAFGYVMRPGFRESKILADYIDRHMQGIAITETEFSEGRWLSSLPELLSWPRIQPGDANGASQIASFICGLRERLKNKE